ncbi:hypothetical protein J5F27_04995 [Schleiferilactobacillus harbinensis]|jgi:hypothetical protein|uniref:hypothetical protein n=1 Tax=Schleiferilactobacillus harbinensis TaxID=304207 RepID=UPI000AEAE9E2|nr:hypothetical protein [Schleiferilactobacillus harbinensis]MBO3091277.1 hypothetical protein [Schleiferilactobacillus harbinensis]GEK07643.1 hypothetical protein LHA01_28820 [Schleiferilactobacillus harbinensis]
MPTVNNRILPIVDYRGRPLNLQPYVTYTMHLKNGYIVALTADQRVERVPNLLNGTTY